MFIVSGIVVSEYAGTASVFSWLLAGIGCMFSAASYTELSFHVPVEGGAYAYAYHTLGELPAVIMAWLLTLEYGLAGSAVARSWGTRFMNFLSGGTDQGFAVISPSREYLEYIFSAVLMSIAVAITALGMDVSKMVASVFTVAKVLLVMFMIIMAYSLWNGQNLKPFAPYGVRGVFTGASASFWSYLGFDEPCMFAGEVINPKRDIPIAMIGTVALTTCIYVLAGLSLSGLLPYSELDSDGAFASGFVDRGYMWAGNLVATGEIVTLPLVALIAFLAQPRLIYIMSVDGLFPKSIGGSIVRASLSAGVVCILVAAFVPFHVQDVSQSAGILFAYNFTHSGIYAKRYYMSEAEHSPSRTENVKQCSSFEKRFWNFLSLNAGQLSINQRSLIMNGLVLAGLIVAVKGEAYWIGCIYIGAALGLLGVIVLLSLYRCCTLRSLDDEQESSFMIPNSCMPWVPAIGFFFNSVLVAQSETIGLLILLGVIGCAVAHYYLYAYRNSVLGQQSHHVRPTTRKRSLD